MKTETPRNIRKLSEEDKRNIRETIADRLAAGKVTLGEAVRLMRLAVGMTQVNYAKMVGVDIRVLIDVEKGQGNPRLDSLEKIARPYGLAVSLVKLAPRSTGVVNGVPDEISAPIAPETLYDGSVALKDRT